MSSLTRWVLAHKRIVVAFWLVVTLVGLATVSSATGALKQKFSVPGREGWETNERITRIYHSGGNNAALVPVVTLPAGTTVSSPQVRAGLTELARRVERAVPGTRIASYATTGDRAFVSKDGRTTFVIAYPPPSKEAFGDNPDAADGSSSAGRDTLTRVRDAAHDAGTGVRVGGIPQQNHDFIQAVYGNFPLMIALIAVVTFILLARAFRSLLLPLKAVLLNVVSVAAAWGLVALVWQEGHGSSLIWGIDATGSVTAWIPLMIFAFLFGLSMDYEVFILACMREEYDRTGDTDAAVVTGIGRMGRLVTSAALILFLAFLSLASGPETDAKVLATGLAAGILLDATVIRALLVPAVVSLFGRWNWWLPHWPARLLRVEPSLPPGTAGATDSA